MRNLTAEQQTQADAAPRQQEGQQQQEQQQQEQQQQEQQQQQDQQQQDQQRQLIFAERMHSLATLAGGIAHEINNPLCYVTSNLHSAIDEVRTLSGAAVSRRMRELEQMLLETLDGVARVAKIVRSLRLFSNGRGETPAAIELSPILELAINAVSHETRGRARIVKQYDEPLCVSADGGQLAQVFVNLLMNAAQSFPPGYNEKNSITVTTSFDGAGHVIVEIADTGKGIAPELLTRIFEPFYTKPIGIGTGLGLSISYSIINSIGGQISVRSELGIGSQFRVSLPAAPPMAPLGRLKSESPIAAAQRPASVLVIDDEPGIGYAIRRILSQHEVVWVANGGSALHLLAAGQKFDVLISDLMMPEMSGMELYKKIAETHPEIAAQVVFITGGASSREASSFLAEVDNARLQKPFTPNQLRLVVDKIAARE